MAFLTQPSSTPSQTGTLILASLSDCLASIKADPTFTLPPDIKRLRQTNFKFEYKQRLEAQKIEGEDGGLINQNVVVTKRKVGRPFLKVRRKPVAKAKVAKDEQKADSEEEEEDEEDEEEEGEGDCESKGNNPGPEADPQS